MNPPPNPHAAEAAAAGREYIRTMLVNPPTFDYRLTWPANQRGVCCIAGQWRRNEAGDIEAWYSAWQLCEVLDAMQAATAPDKAGCATAEGTTER